MDGFGSNNAFYSFITFIFLLTPFSTTNCCFLNQISAWCCLLKCFLQKDCNVVLYSKKHEKVFPHEFIFFFILHFIGTITAACGSSSIYS